MKVAILGTWHVHVVEYTQKALQFGEVVGFYEKDDKMAASFQSKFDLPRFNTLDELLESDAEGVIVCSASCDHTEDMIRVANAKKNIFTEKVLALTDEDCEKIEKAVNENGVSFTISLFQKYKASRIAVKDIASSGELGKINYVRFRNCHSGSTRNWLPLHFFNKKECGGGAMIDLGAHGMYLIHWLLGTPISASSAFTVSCTNETANAKNTDNVEDNAVTVMTFADGAIAVNETSFVSNYPMVYFEAHGEDGYVRMEGERVFKSSSKTEGKLVEVELGDSLPLPIEQFMTGNILEGCSMEEAKALTHMMTLAYNNIQ